MAKNGTLHFTNDEGDEIQVTKGKFVTQEALAEHQKLQRAEKKFKAKAKAKEDARKELERVFVVAHLNGQRSAKGEGKLFLEVKEGTNTSIPWKEICQELCEKHGEDFAALEKKEKKERQKKVHKVKVI